MPHCVLSDIAIIENGEFVSENYYGNIGKPYIRGTDIKEPVVDVENAIKVSTKLNNLKTVEKNDIVFAMIGSVGNVSIYKDNNSAIVSNNLGAIKPYQRIKGNYLYLVLQSYIGQAFFEKYQTRTAQPKIKKEDVSKF